MRIFLCRCGTLSLTLMDERRLRLFEGRVMRGIFVPKRDDLTGECRIVHNEETNYLYSSPKLMGVIKLGRI